MISEEQVADILSKQVAATTMAFAPRMFGISNDVNDVMRFALALTARILEGAKTMHESQPQ